MKATGSRRAARTEHLPQIAVRQGVGQEYADAINLGREQGSIDVARDTPARLGSARVYQTVRKAP